MNLDDVAEKTVPKMSLLSPPQHRGVVSTRTFIPHRVHQSIGVLSAASVAAGCCIEGSVGSSVAGLQTGGALDVEHPSGRFTVDIAIENEDGEILIRRSALLRTARKLMDGHVYAQDAQQC